MSCRILLRCVGMAVLDKGLRGLLKETPFAGYLIDIATSAYDHFQRECRENREFQAIQSKVDKTLDAVSDGASKAFANIQKQSNPDNKGSVELREIESAACATMDEIKVEAREVLAEIRRQAAPELRAKLDDPILQNNMLGYLEQIPGTVRASLKRPSDPSGKSLPKGFALSSADDFLKILPTQPPRFKAGDMPVGNWKLLDLLGVGGFGEVWKAEHPSLKGIPPVALKFCLSPDSARFLRHEGELLSRVMEVSANNPGIVKLRQAYIESDTPCLEYEFINGGDLCGLMSEWLNMPKERRTLLALQMLLKLARTIAPLHTMNPPIVHRDLKPANVLVVRTADGKINLKIGDFGIGGLATKQAIEGQSKGASQGEILTQTLRGSHTPLYAGPEQQRGDPPHPTDDVHALGVIGFQLLVCDLRRGPTGDWDEELRELGVSDPIIAMFKQCIARQARRYPHAGALADELQNLIDSKPSTAAKPALPVPPVPAAIQVNPFADAVTAPQSTTSRSPVIDKTPPIPDDKSKKSQPRVQKRESNLNWVYRLAAIALIGVVVILGIAIYRNNTRNPDSEAEAMQLKLSKELNEKILQMNAQANARKTRDIPKETKQAPTEIINYAKSNQRKDEPTRAKGFDASALPNYLRISIDKNSSISLTKITPNKFMMGSPLSEQGRLPNESQREVVLTEPFYIGETEVTQAQFISVMGLNPSIHREPTNISYLPVDNASYEDAMSFCRVLSSKFDHPFKLPTEAQWEFACRAATDTPFSFGLSFNGDSANANGLFPYGDSKPGPNLGKTTNVGSYRPNTFNLYDMHGNVWEWCSDWFGDYDPNATTDPSGPPNGKFHVRRGGSWKDLASSGAHRAASRAPETLQEGVTGFRIIIACSDVRQEYIRKKNEASENIPNVAQNSPTIINPITPPQSLTQEKSLINPNNLSDRFIKGTIWENDDFRLLVLERNGGIFRGRFTSKSYPTNREVFGYISGNQIKWASKDVKVLNKNGNPGGDNYGTFRDGKIDFVFTTPDNKGGKFTLTLKNKF